MMKFANLFQVLIELSLCLLQIDPDDAGGISDFSTYDGEGYGQ